MHITTATGFVIRNYADLHKEQKNAVVGDSYRLTDDAIRKRKP